MTKAIPVRRRQEDRTALSDEKMLKAAIELLVESGTPGTTLAAIGERAGYSRGLVTHRFGSKAGLLAHVHDAVSKEWVAHVNARVGKKVGVQAMECVVDAVDSFIVNEPDEIRAMYLLRYASIDPGVEYRANVAKMHKAQRRDVMNWINAGKEDGSIRRSVDAGLAADLFLSALDGVLYRWLVNSTVPIHQLNVQIKRELSRLLPKTTRRSSRIQGIK